MKLLAPGLYTSLFGESYFDKMQTDRTQDLIEVVLLKGLWLQQSSGVNVILGFLILGLSLNAVL